jgi:hypothetical protein
MPLSDEKEIKNYDVLRGIRQTMIEMRNKLMSKQEDYGDQYEDRINELDRKIDAITQRLKRDNQPLQTKKPKSLKRGEKTK